jgi:adenylylsulfate reductase subunit B
MGHKVRVLREEEKGTISWKIVFRNGTEKNFVSPITTKPWGKHIHKVAEAEVPDQAAHESQLLFNEPDYLKIGDNRDAKLINPDGLPSRAKDTFKQGVYY